MPARFVRPVSLSARLSRRAGYCALVIFLAAALLHRFGPLTTPDFVALLLASAAIGVCAILLAAVGIVRLWAVGAKGGIAATRGLVYALLPVCVVGAGLWFYLTLPPLYDVSSDIGDPPPWLVSPQANQQWLPPRPALTPQYRAVQATGYPGLAGRRYEGAIDRVYEAVKLVAENGGITLVRSVGASRAEPDLLARPLRQGPAGPGDSDDIPDVVPVPLPRPAVETAAPVFSTGNDVLLQGQTRTLIFGLRFDVMIRLREGEETTLVDIRVASRFGPHDLGLSDDIAEAYLRALDAQLLGIGGT